VRRVDPRATKGTRTTEMVSIHGQAVIDITGDEFGDYGSANR
jgi:hypothetical protein